MPDNLLFWVGFNLFLILALTADLLWFNRKAHVVSIRESLGWCLAWVVIALLFCLGVYYFKGKEPALTFFAGYLVEYSLSMDNVFVFILIFSFFRVDPLYQHKVLFWGIVLAVIMRLIFIFAGVALIEKFEWILYIFGVFLVITGAKMALQKDKEIHPEKNPILKFVRRFIPLTDSYFKDQFFVRIDGKQYGTLLFVVVLVVATSDLIFAVDSIPAVLAITRDPLIVYTSNVFAIMGLRSLFFTLAGVMRLFRHLHYGLALILIFVGLKMLLEDYLKQSHDIEIPVGISLGVIAAILLGTVITSILYKTNYKHGAV